CPRRPSNRRIAHRNCIVRNVINHDRVRSDYDVVPYPSPAQHLGARPYVDVISNFWRAGLIDALKAYDDARAYPAVVAKFGIAADDDSREVVDNEIAPDFDLAGELDACDHLDPFVKNFVHQRKT